MSDIDTIATLITHGKLQEAHHDVNVLLERESSDAKGWFLKGVICSRLEDNATAISCFNQALQHKPYFHDAALNLGRALEKAGQLLLAIRVFEHLLSIEQMGDGKKPPAKAVNVKKVETWFHKGEAFQQRGDQKNAAAAFRKVLEFHPDLPEALINLGLSLHKLRQHAEAESVLLHALRIVPDNPHALNILAGNYAVSGELLRAIAAWIRIVAAHPDHYDAQLNLAKAFSNMKWYDEAIKAYEQVLRLRPQSPEILMELLHMHYRLCRWEQAGQVMARLRSALAANPQWMEQFMVTVHLPELQLENARLYVKRFYPAGVAYDPKRPLPADARGDGKLRIGYLSSDFHRHATTYLISELFEQHDKNRFDIIVYSCGVEDHSAERERVRQSVSHFRDLQAMGNDSAMELIRRDGIDILIDLKGHTTNERMSLVAMRPAPIQMHYIGHPGTIGAPFIDYFIADSIAAPEGEDAAFLEKLIRLPHSYQINDRKRPLPHMTLPRSAYGLPDDAFVFCNFNSAHKITPEVFSVWMRLLASVPGSVLWLYETHAEATANMRAIAEQQGIDPARIVVARSAPLAEHLERYLQADLIVDVLPYNGHTTTSDALWCGVPVVTVAGNCFVSRVAASLLHAVGLPELVTGNLAEYETLALALALAHNPDKLQQIKHYLEQGRMTFPLFDSAATTRALESAYLYAAERHRAGKAPAAFTVAAALPFG